MSPRTTGESGTSTPRRRTGRGSAGASATAAGNTKKATGAPKSVWLRRFKVFCTIISVISVCALALSGYAGYVSPLSHNSYWGVLPLAFQFVFWWCLLTGVIQLFFNRLGSVVILAGFIITGGPVLDYFPLHTGTAKAPANTTTFTLMTYNTLEMARRNPADSVCHQMNYIISTKADVVCLQEGDGFFPSKKTGVTSAQLDSIHAIYPNVCISGGTETQVILSKYPVEPLHLDVSKQTFPGGDIAAYRVELPTGRRITIFNVHMHSMGIRNNELKRDSIGTENLKRTLEKIRKAAVGRARATNKLVQWLRQYGGPDVIVCGDFNDAQGCHAIRVLGDYGFKDAYTEVGFGPMITYNDQHLYFCIDHILYRGDLKPLWLKKGKLKASDHYPLTAEFAVTD